MSRLSASWLFGIRHALVAMAVLATLASAFGVHVHAGDIHERRDHSFSLTDGRSGDHGCSKISTCDEMTADDEDEFDTKADSDKSCHCHCQPSVTDLPALAGNLTSLDCIVKLLTPRDELIRVGVSYRPDPPPVLG